MKKFPIGQMGLTFSIFDGDGRSGPPNKEDPEPPLRPPYKDTWFNPIWESNDKNNFDDYPSLAAVPYQVMEFVKDSDLMNTLENQASIEFHPVVFSPKTGNPYPARKDKKYFLVRVVTYYGQVSSVMIKNNKVLATSSIMTHGYPVPSRSVLLLELDEKPSDVYVMLNAAS